ncbi:outer membrane beta-barrel protein [Spirosoma litoris]
MRIVFWFVVSYAVLALVNRGVAQDSLLYNPNPLVLTHPTSIDAFAPFKWRLSGTIGYHQLQQKGYLNDNLYLTNGVQTTLSADYFVGRNWGLGVLAGYQNLRVSDLYRLDKSIPLFPTPHVLPLTSQHSFMLAVGPAFSFPLSQRLLFDVELRGGVFYNDAPILGAYISGTTQDNLLNGTYVTTVSPSDQRARIGFTGSAGFKYQVSPQIGLGLSANTTLTSLGYTQVNSSNGFSQKRLDMNTIGVQFGVSYRFLSSKRQGSNDVPARAPKPVCYPPILDPNQPNEYEVGINSRPTLKWRSSAPIYTEGEQYSFRLYTLPGNRLIYEKTGKDSQFIWPTQLALPDSASYFFYSVSTVRNDEFEQSCRSEPVAGTLGFYIRPSARQAAIPREPAPIFALKLYELSLERVARVTSKATKPAPKPVSPSVARTDTIRANSVKVDSVKTAALRPDSVRSDSARTKAMRSDSIRTDSIRLDSARANAVRSDSARAIAVRSDSVRADSAKITAIRSDSVRANTELYSSKIVFRLLYEGETQELDFSWPSRLPLPTQPTVYQYTINRINSQQLLQNNYIIVEPDGCSIVIGEATKNQRLHYMGPRAGPIRQPSIKKPTRSPTKKGKP